MQLTNRDDLKYYAKMAQRKAGYVAGQVELTSKCEQFCPNCDSWKKHKSGVINDRLHYETLASLFRQLNGMRTFEHLALTGGDPVSHEDWGTKILPVLLQEPRQFKVQVNTALPLPVGDPLLWREGVDSLRVSLDGITKETYYKMRGVKIDPMDVVRRIDSIRHPFWAVNICVAPANVGELDHIASVLGDMEHPPRRMNFLAVLDRGEQNEEFWKEYTEQVEFLKEMSPIPTSAEEDVQEMNAWKMSEEAREVPCAAGGISFHIKCNGDVYPCCLVGGEAIVTRPEYRLGNIRSGDLKKIHAAYFPAKHYNTPGCRAVCQWKQVQINRLAHAAKDIHMRMP